MLAKIIDALKSRTVIGGIIATVCGILAALFKWSPGTVEAIQTSATETLASLGAVLGGVLAIYGRVKADRKIGGGELE